MAAVTAMPYNENKLGTSTVTMKTDNLVDPEGDTASATYSIQTGASSGWRTDGLSRLSRHSIKIKSSSSFPNLLNLYREPIREESNLESLKKHKETPKKSKDTKPGRRRRRGEVLGDNEDYHESRARHEIRTVRIETVAREQLEKFDSYVTNLQTKVERQREQRRKYNEALQERLREQEEHEKRKLRLHRGPKHVYIHDRKYLKTLPESNFCKMTRLADELQKKGVIRTEADKEKFWNGMGRRRARGKDIFAPETFNSVHYPSQWVTMKKPEIRLDDSDDEGDETPREIRQNRKTLPPLESKPRKTKRKKKP